MSLISSSLEEIDTKAPKLFNNKNKRNIIPVIKNKTTNIKKETNVKMIENVKENQKVPSLSIIGCGGAGLNLVQNFNKAYEDEFDNYKSLLIDTSKSNLINAASDNTDLYLIDKGSVGSGKYRAKNYSTIKSSIKELVSNIKYNVADINIVLFSLSGGSGSIIGPLLIKHLLDLNKRVICVTISSESSKIDLINGLNTFKSLYNISKQYYLPISLADNTKGREVVDKSINECLYHMVTVFLSRGAEIDFEDKMHFLAPNKVINNLKKGMHIFCTSSEIDTDNDLKKQITGGFVIPDNIDSIDSMFILSKQIEDFRSIVPSMVTYQGYDNIKEDNIILTILSASIPQSFIDHLTETLNEINIKADTNLSFNDNVGETIDDSEIVL